MAETTLIFDGHNDVLTRLLQRGGASAAKNFGARGQNALDRVSAADGGWGGGFFAIWVPSPMDPSARMARMQGDAYDMPLPPMLGRDAARQVVDDEMAILSRLETLGYLTVCRDVDELKAAFGSDRLAAICHIEGAEAISSDLNELPDLYDRGLRSLGPVWSRETVFGHGVPFRFPSTPDTGPGLTDAGKRLVAACDEMGIMLDLSHLNAAGFWDVARLSRRPLVATHSNAHSVSPHARNLTDEQLDGIAASDGVVGVNFACAFLRPDGRMRGDTPVDLIIRHMDHLLERLGEDRVAIGSDYDGALVPSDLRSVSNLAVLRAVMVEAGYDADLIEKICHRNWFRVLRKAWE